MMERGLGLLKRFELWCPTEGLPKILVEVKKGKLQNKMDSCHWAQQRKGGKQGGGNQVPLFLCI